MPKNSFFYMLTLAILFFLYSITEYNGGNGAIAVFVFGLLMGHMEEINALINFDNDRKVDKKFLLFQDEVTFFVRTFFFVYIGLLLSVKYVNFITIYFSLLVLAIAVVARSIGSFIIFKDCDSKEKIILNSMIPRGLAAAVLVTYVGGDVMIMYLEEIVFMVILVTNIFPSLMVYLLDSKFLNIDSSEETEQEI
jgi:cell volume regulation protein A